MEDPKTIYINFIDYEKAFDSLDRNTLWDLMASYGIPGKIISLVKNTYEGTSCRILHDSGLTEKFSIKTGVRQGCLLSLFLFLLAIDWAMKETISDSRNGIQWTLVGLSRWPTVISLHGSHDVFIKNFGSSN